MHFHKICNIEKNVMEKYEVTFFVLEARDSNC